MSYTVTSQNSKTFDQFCNFHFQGICISRDFLSSVANKPLSKLVRGLIVCLLGSSLAFKVKASRVLAMITFLFSVFVYYRFF